MKEWCRRNGEPMAASFIEQVEQRLLEEQRQQQPAAEADSCGGSGGQEGPEDDAIAQQDAQHFAPLPSGDEPSGRGAEAAELFAQLQQLDAGAAREDYFDADSGIWDEEGLRDDLRLRLDSIQAAPAPSSDEPGGQDVPAEDQEDTIAQRETVQVELPPPSGEEPSSRGAEAAELFAQLQQLDAGTVREDYFDADSGIWDEEGLRDDLSLLQDSTQAVPAPSSGEPCDRGAEAEELFAQLQQLDASAAREDYFDDASGHWDTEGLQEDLRLATQDSGASEQQPAAQAHPEPDPEAEAIFAQLAQLDSGAEKEDYFDEESGEWDVDGLRGDLALAEEKADSARQGQQAQAVPEAHQVESEDLTDEAEEILAELQRLEADAAKDDYYDSETGEWDISGLREDLRLAQQSQPADAAEARPEAGATDAGTGASAEEDPLTQFHELAELDAGVNKEDYYDEESGEWDIVGLRDDLNLMRTSSATAGTNEAPRAPAPVAPVAEKAEDGALELWEALQALDGEASKEDYFDEESGQWDVQGLQDDLSLAQQTRGAASPVAAPEQEDGLQDPEALLAHLSTFDPAVTKRSYYSDGKWDVERLKEDLQRAKESIAVA